MTSIDFGVGETYTTLKDALVGVTWNDDYEFEMISDTVSTSPIVSTDFNQLGHSVVINLNGFELSDPGFTLFDWDADAATNRLDIEIYNGTITSASTVMYLWRSNTYGTGLHYCSIHHCYLGFNSISPQATDVELDFYQNHLDVGASSLSIVSPKGDSVISIEDSFIDISSTVSVSPPFELYDDSIVRIKRTYMIAPSTISGMPMVSGTDVVGLETELYCSFDNELYGQAPLYTEIAFEQGNFKSITSGNDNYGVPMGTNPMILTASQDSNISANTGLGLNGVTEEYLSAGCYSVPAIVIAPLADNKIIDTVSLVGTTRITIEMSEDTTGINRLGATFTAVEGDTSRIKDVIVSEGTKRVDAVK